MNKKTLKSMLFTGVTALTLAASSINVNAQSYILQERANRQQEPVTVQDPVSQPTTQQPTFTITETKKDPAYEPAKVKVEVVEEPKFVDRKINYDIQDSINFSFGSFSVAEKIKSFKIPLGDPYHLMDTAEVHVKTKDGRAVGRMVYDSEELIEGMKVVTWKYDGLGLTDFGIGKHELEMVFPNTQNQATYGSIDFEITNESPVLGKLNYTLRDLISGETTTKALEPTKRGSNFDYDAGSIPANYILESLSFRATDEDGNLIIRDKPVFYGDFSKGIKVGDMSYNSKDSTFNYENGSAHLKNLPLGNHKLEMEVYDVVGETVKGVFRFNRIGSAPVFRGPYVEFDDGSQREAEKLIEEEPKKRRGLFRRKYD